MNFNHKTTALQFSGGRDSLATLYWMRDHWDDLTVYWLNTQNAFPETLELMDKVRRMVPHFCEVAGSQPDSFREHGLATDLLPAEWTPIGIHSGGSAGPLMQSRYDCCWRVLMEPLHRAMKQDGIKTIIRGERSSDTHRAGLRSGQMYEGIEYYFPIEEWSDEEVMGYLRLHKVEIPKFYEDGGTTSFDCMDCTAWWGEGRAAYLKKHHPEAAKRLSQRLNQIEHAILFHARQMQDELE